MWNGAHTVRSCSVCCCAWESSAPPRSARRLSWKYSACIASSATAAGAVDVTVSDHSPLSLELVLHAAAAFQPGRKIHTCEVDLRDRQQQLPPHDYLVAADLMYDDDVAFALGRHVRAQRERGATAILADPGRKGGRFRAAFARGLGEDVHFVEQRLPKRWRADVPSTAGR